MGIGADGVTNAVIQVGMTTFVKTKATAIESVCSALVKVSAYYSVTNVTFVTFTHKLCDITNNNAFDDILG